MKIPTVGDVKPWMCTRENEVMELVDALLQPYCIQSFDASVNASGAIIYNTIAARLQNRIYWINMKIPGDMVDIPIPKFIPLDKAKLH